MTFLLSEKYPELRSLPMENGSNLGQKVSPGSEGVVAVMAAVSAEVSFASAATHSPNFSITMRHLFNSFQCLFLFSSFPLHHPHIFISRVTKLSLPVSHSRSFTVQGKNRRKARIRSERRHQRRRLSWGHCRNSLWTGWALGSRIIQNGMDKMDNSNIPIIITACIWSGVDLPPHRKKPVDTKKKHVTRSINRVENPTALCQLSG